MDQNQLCLITDTNGDREREERAVERRKEHVKGSFYIMALSSDVALNQRGVTSCNYLYETQPAKRKLQITV